jgi:hypothetical protein
MNRILKWELWAIAFVFLLGALLHLFLSGPAVPPVVGAIASVNESVREHFKQGFWPMIIYALIELRYLGIHQNLWPPRRWLSI